MPRPKKSKTKAAKTEAAETLNGNGAKTATAAVVEPVAESLRPPTTPVETPQADKPQPKAAPAEGAFFCIFIPPVF